jgi:hypothetical protein
MAGVLGLMPIGLSLAYIPPRSAGASRQSPEPRPVIVGSGNVRGCGSTRGRFPRSSGGRRSVAAVQACQRYEDECPSALGWLDGEHGENRPIALRERQHLGPGIGTRLPSVLGTGPREGRLQRGLHRLGRVPSREPLGAPAQRVRWFSLHLDALRRQHRPDLRHRCVRGQSRAGKARGEWAEIPRDTGHRGHQGHYDDARQGRASHSLSSDGVRPLSVLDG